MFDLEVSVLDEEDKVCVRNLQAKGLRRTDARVPAQSGGYVIHCVGTRSPVLASLNPSRYTRVRSRRPKQVHTNTRFPDVERFVLMFKERERERERA